MTNKSIVFKFVVLTTIAVALGIIAGPNVVGYFDSPIRREQGTPSAPVLKLLSYHPPSLRAFACWFRI